MWVSCVTAVISGVRVCLHSLGHSPGEQLLTHVIEHLVISALFYNACLYIFSVSLRTCYCRRNRDAQLRATINQKLIETGERDRCIHVFDLVRRASVVSPHDNQALFLHMHILLWNKRHLGSWRPPVVIWCLCRCMCVMDLPTPPTLWWVYVGTGQITGCDENNAFPADRHKNSLHV